MALLRSRLSCFVSRGSWKMIPPGFVFSVTFARMSEALPERLSYTASVGRSVRMWTAWMEPLMSTTFCEVSVLLLVNSGSLVPGKPSSVCIVLATDWKSSVTRRSAVAVENLSFCCVRS